MRVPALRYCHQILTNSVHTPDLVSRCPVATVTTFLSGEHMLIRPQSVRARCRRHAVLATALALSVAAPVPAAQFASGDVTGSFDTTLSYGTSWRVEGRDTGILGVTSTTQPNGSAPPGSLGGTAFSVNGDDGNLNYDKGLVSNILTAVFELGIDHASGYGAFVRARAFYDFENEDGDREKIDLTDDAKKLVGSDLKLLDAYVYGSLNLGSAPAELRLGNQVVSWGESTFIQNGINVINPIDVPAIRVPGAELRDALLPVPMAWGSVDINESNTIEGFYQFAWDDTDPEPSGSYFSTNDFATDGGNKLMLGFGAIPDIVPVGAPVNVPIGPAVPRGEDVEPSDSGQFGLAYRLYVPQFHDTELGFYYVNYHSRLPIISARTGSLGALASGNYAASAQYFVEFPEDIKLLGASFNTQLGTTGWALQGELSHKLDVPLQVDDVELLFAALSPLSATGNPAGVFFAQQNQVAPGGVGFDTVVPGFIRRDVTQFQVTATGVYANLMGADQLGLVAELGFTHVHSMPDKGELRMESAGTYTSGNPIATLAGVQPATELASSFADATSAGYQIRGRLIYNNAIGPVALLPSFAFRHDFSGNSPGPGGNFLEGRKALSLALGANLRNEWTAEVRYTSFFGAGRFNLLNDRDFISFNIKYSR